MELSKPAEVDAKKLWKKSRAAKLFKTRAGTKTDLYEDVHDVKPRSGRQYLAPKRGFFSKKVAPRSEEEIAVNSGKESPKSRTETEINDAHNQVVSRNITLPPAALFVASDKRPKSAKDKKTQ